MSRILQDVRHAFRATRRSPLVSIFSEAEDQPGGAKVAVLMLNDVTANDPLVFAGTAVAVLSAAMLASYLPALSAGKTDPMLVLRDS